MSSSHYSLAELGWHPVFMQQLSLDDLEQGRAARVAAVHRDRLIVLTETGEQPLDLTGQWLKAAPDERPTVGDWLWWYDDSERPMRLLERQSLVKRTASGSNPRPQLIAANLDTMFVVSSCNADFNPSRLERYLALAFSAGVDPVLVLTKADRCDDPEAYRQRAQSIRSDVPVVVLNALDEGIREALAPWLSAGQTLAFVGSSGVGKSTLANTLMGRESQATQSIREDDAKGRHTTTSRQLVRLPGGAWVMDTPGMRELRLGDATDGVHRLFDDLDELASQCRFNDCHHQGDDGCALEAAVEAGELEPRRLQSYLKLLRETERASQTTWQQREKWKSFGKMARRVQREKQARSGRAE